MNRLVKRMLTGVMAAALIVTCPQTSFAAEIVDAQYSEITEGGSADYDGAAAGSVIDVSDTGVSDADAIKDDTLDNLASEQVEDELFSTDEDELTSVAPADETPDELESEGDSDQLLGELPDAGLGTFEHYKIIASTGRNPWGNYGTGINADGKIENATYGVYYQVIVDDHYCISNKLYEDPFNSELMRAGVYCYFANDPNRYGLVITYYDLSGKNIDNFFSTSEYTNDTVYGIDENNKYTGDVVFVVNVQPRTYIHTFTDNDDVTISAMTDKPENVTFANDGSSASALYDENKKELGFSFKVEPVEGKVITDVTAVATGTTTPVNVTFDRDTGICSVSDAYQDVTYTVGTTDEEIYTIPVYADNAIVNYGTKPDDIKEEIIQSFYYGHNVSVLQTKYHDLYFTVENKKGYTIENVTATIGNSKVSLVPDEEKGFYKLTADQVSKCKDITATITEIPALSVIASVNGDSDLSKNGVIITGATKSGSAYTTKNSAVTASYKIPDGYKLSGKVKVCIGGVELTEGTEGFIETNIGNTYSWNISADKVESAWENKKSPISFEIFTKSVNGFNVDLQGASHSQFATKNATIKNGVYELNKNVKDFTFTVTSDIGYIPVVKIGDSEPESGVLTTDKSNTKRIYTYTVPAEKVRDNTIVITDSEAPLRTFKVYYEKKRVVPPTISIGGKYIGGKVYQQSDILDVAVFEVPDLSTVTLRTEAKANYSIKSFKIGDQTSAAKNGVFTFVVSELASSVHVESEGTTSVFTSVNEGDWTLTADKAKFSMAGSDKIAIKVCAGNASEEAIESSVTAKAGGVDRTELLTIENKVITVDASKFINLQNNNTLTLTMTGSFGTRTLTFVIAQPVASAELAGFKNNKPAEQVAGTKASYKVTLKPSNADYSSVKVVKVSGENASVDEQLTVDSKGNRYVNVYTYEGTKLATGDIEFKLVDKTNVDKSYGEFVVKSKAVGSIAAPTVKLLNATDIGMTLSLTSPKSLEGYKNLVYKLEANANIPNKKTLAAGMVQSVAPVYVAVTDGAVEVPLYLMADTEVALGGGHAQKYDIKASIIQVKDSSETNIGNDENVLKAGSEKKFSASTKEPCWETGFGLNKKTTTLTIGQRNVLLATAKYSSKTTFTGAGSAELLDANGNIVAGSEKLSFSKSGEIRLMECPDNLLPGKYTLRAFPQTKDASAYVKAATLAVTINAPVPVGGIHLSAPSTKLCKQPGKQVSVKVSAQIDDYAVTQDGVTSYFKPSNKNVTWEITSDNQELQNALKINNGTVTVTKDFVLSGNDSDNKFTVKAKATDLGDASAVGSLVFKLSTESIIPVALYIGNVPGETGKEKPVAKVTTEFEKNDGKLRLYVAGSNTPLTVSELRNMSISITPSKGLTLDDNFRAKVTKTGTYTVKVTSNDGSKNTLSAKFAVKSDEITGYDVKVIAYKPFAKDIYSNSSIKEFADVIFEETDGINAASNIEADLLYVYVTPKGKNGGFVDAKDATVSFGKTASKVSNSAHDGLCLKPLKDKVELEVTTKDKVLSKDKYIINLKKHTSSSLSSMAGKSGYSLMGQSTESQTLQFKVTGSTGKILFIPNESAYSKTATLSNANMLCDVLNNSNKTQPVDGVITLTLSQTSGVVAGTYDLYASLCNTQMVGVPGQLDILGQLSDPIPVKINVTAPKKPSAALNLSKVQLPKVYKENAGITILTKTFKNAIRIENPILLNNNNNGVVNDFVSKFNIRVGDDGKSLVLERKNDVIPDGTDQMIGWIRYNVVGEDGHTIVQYTEKVTVKLLK